MAYTDIDLVCSLFPTFKRGTPQQNPQDSVIETYLENDASKLRGKLLRRFEESFAASNLPTVDAWLAGLPQAQDAHNVLEELNRHGAAVALVDVFAAYGVSGVRDLAAKILVPKYQELVAAFDRGEHDKLFDPLARGVTPRPLFQGIGGAETDRSTPEDRGEDRKFGINQTF